jgi:hypothetical protein
MRSRIERQQAALRAHLDLALRALLALRDARMVVMVLLSGWPEEPRASRLWCLRFR